MDETIKIILPQGTYTVTSEEYQRFFDMVVEIAELFKCGVTLTGVDHVTNVIVGGKQS